jgi:hypothetical protein
VAGSGRDEENGSRLHLVNLVADGDSRLSAEYVLLMLHGVGMAGHASTGPHDETPHGKMGGAVLRPQENLHFGFPAGGDGLPSGRVLLSDDSSGR